MNTVPLSNSLQTRLRKLAQKKFRLEFREYLLEGLRIVEEALLQERSSIRFIAVDEDRLNAFPEQIASANERNIPVYTVPSKLFTELASTEHSQGVMAVCTMPEDASPLQQTAEAVTALFEASDPGNLGTVIRTGDWFGLPGILLSPGSADPYNPKTVRATMGSIFRAEIGRFESPAALAEAAGEAGFTVMAADSAAPDSLYDINLPRKTVFIFGSEAHGLPYATLESAATMFSIPRFGNAESLNLATSHAVVLAEYRRRYPEMP